MLFIALSGCTQSTTTDTSKEKVVEVKDSTTAQEALVSTTNSLDNIETAFNNINEDLIK